VSVEKKIQRKTVEYARKKGMLAFKIDVGAQRGWPDYLFVDTQGYHFWIEFKAPGKKPQPIQLHRAHELTHRGVVVFLVDNEEEGKRIIDAVDSSRVPEEGDRAPAESGERRIITGPGIRKD